ncbi:MAG: PEP-CTERM sorting domain-containing protein [Duganella sp.]
MNKLLLKTTLVFVTFVGSFAGARADVITLTGDNFDVQYDASYWRGVALVDDRIVLSTSIEFYAAPGLSYYTEFGSALTVVAHAGYVFTGGATIGVTGSYTLPGYLNGPYGPDGGARIHAGAMVFGNQDFGDYLGFASAGSAVAATPEASAGVFGPAGATQSFVQAGQYTQLRLNPILDLYGNPKFTTTTLTGASFDLDVAAVSAVPEPQALTMLLGGLALLGVCARRRRGNSRR